MPATKHISKLSSVGNNIRKERKALKLSLDELSNRSGVSKGMLSQVETDKVNPTVATIWKISQALEVELNQLIKGEKDEDIKLFEVSRAEDISVLDTDAEGTHISVLSSVASAGEVELYRIRIEAKCALKSKPHIKGSSEHLTVLSGHVRIKAGSRSAELRSGDVATYDGDVIHSIENLAKEEADLYLVVRFT